MKMEQVYGELELAKSEMERLKLTVNEKESLIQHLKNQRSESDSKLRKLEDEKIELLKALDKAEGANKGKERAMGVLQSELDNIKVMLYASQKKCSDAEQEAKALKEWSLKDDRLGRLEEEKRKLEEHLKWKKEQFELLQQAHEKLKSESKACKREWELERCSLLNDMSAVQSTLNCHNRKAESFKTQLDKCKQALALEEIRRQNLEYQVSEMKTSVSNDCWDEENSSDLRKDNDEVSALRDSMREMESDLKEAKYRAKKLEKENQDLVSTVRELQECHIPKSTPPPSTVAKIKSKLRSVEIAHKDCALNLRSKEADWNSEMQVMRREMEDSRFCLKMKDASINELKNKLDDYNAMNTELKLQNEELSLMLQIQIQNSGDNGAEKYKEILDECCRERDGLKQEVEELSGVVENLQCELSEKLFEGSEIEFELQIWKSASERLQAELEESQRVRGELEVSLLAQAGFEEELKLEMCNLKQLIPEYEVVEEEEEESNKQFLNTAVGKGIEIRGSVERSPFREIN